MPNKLMDDLKAVPSWVWLGGAAAVGLLFVLGRSGASSAASTDTSQGAVTSSAVPTLGQNISDLQSYGIYDQLSQLETQVQQLLNTQQPTPTGTGTTTGTTTDGGASSGGGGNGNPPNVPVVGGIWSYFKNTNGHETYYSAEYQPSNGDASHTAGFVWTGSSWSQVVPTYNGAAPLSGLQLYLSQQLGGAYTPMTVSTTNGNFGMPSWTPQ